MSFVLSHLLVALIAFFGGWFARRFIEKKNPGL